MKAWYAVYCQARMEAWAQSNLWERGLEVYLPRYRKRRRHARKVDVVAVPLFPGYLFVEADLGAGDRRRIASAPGVRSLVAFGNRPAPVAPAIIAEIRAREDASGFILLSPVEGLKPGDRVAMQHDAFDEVLGLVEGIGDNERVIILLDLLGRQVRVHAPAEAIQRLT